VSGVQRSGERHRVKAMEAAVIICRLAFDSAGRR
jgi:hypothetical protein